MGSEMCIRDRSVSVSLSAFCAAPESATLFAGPGTTIDGEAAMNGTRVFPPAMLRTPKGQFSELLLPGSSVRLLESSARYTGDSMELLDGGISLKTSNGFKVQSECMTATPEAAKPARYTVQRLDKTVYVSVHEGTVSVQAKRSAQVPSGRTVAVFCGSPKQEILFAGSNLPATVLMGTAAAASPLALLPKADMSGETTTH